MKSSKLNRVKKDGIKAGIIKTEKQLRGKKDHWGQEMNVFKWQSLRSWRKTGVGGNLHTHKGGRRQVPFGCNVEVTGLAVLGYSSYMLTASSWSSFCQLLICICLQKWDPPGYTITDTACVLRCHSGESLQETAKVLE